MSASTGPGQDTARVVKRCVCGWELNVADTTKAVHWATWQHDQHKDACPLWGIPVDEFRGYNVDTFGDPPTDDGYTVNQYSHRNENRDAS